MNTFAVFRWLLLFSLVQGVPAQVTPNQQGIDATLEAILPVAYRGAGHGQDAAPSAEDPGAIFREGKRAMQAGDLALAGKDFRRVIVLDPNSGAAHINLGVVYMREKHWKDAMAELHVAESLTPHEPGILLNIGLVHYRENDFSAAIEPFSELLRQKPDSLQGRYLLGLCYFFTNKYKQASDTLSPLWEGELANLNYLYVLSIAASKSSNAPLQKKAFDQMIAIGQNTPEFHLYMGKAWLAEGDTGKALTEFTAAATARPDLPLVHYFLGRSYLERHEYTQGEAELKKDASFEPDFAYTYEDLGILYVLLNQPEKAEVRFRQAIERNDTLVNSYFGLAKLYRDEGRPREALEMADHAETLAPTSAGIHYTRGQILKSLGQSAKAKQEFQTAASLFKEFNDGLQQDRSGDRFADAQDAARE